MPSLPQSFILLIGENSIVRELLQQAFQPDEAHRYFIIEKESGQEGLDELEKFPIKAVILCAPLADMTAQQWLIAARARSLAQSPAVITVLEENDPQTARAISDAGGQFCLARPQLTAEALRQMVERAIELTENREAASLSNLPKEGMPDNLQFIRFQRFADHDRVLQDNDQRLALTLEAAEVGYWEWNIPQNTAVFSGYAATIFGIDRESFDGNSASFFRLVHPDDYPIIEQRQRHLFDSEGEKPFEYRIIRPDGEMRWLLTQGRTYFSDSGQPLLRLGIVRDVTDRKLTDAALRESEKLNQAVLDSLPESIAVVDRKGNIVAVNRAWMEFGLHNGAQEIASRLGIGANYLTVCKEAKGEYSEEASAVCEGIQAVLDGRLEHFKVEYPCHSPTEARWFLLQVTPLSLAQSGAVISHLDITDRKKIEAERVGLLAESQLARQTAEAANRAKDEFIAQITHDLRSPLNAILGWTKVLRNKKLDEGMMAEALETIEKSADKQKNLIDDLLDLSRITSGKLRLDVRPLSLSQVIRSAMEVMMPACEAKGIDCITELATEADAISGDSTRLEQVIWNLVSNAVKFTHGGGKVTVRLERADPYVRISVTDTGQGISAQHLPYIFNRYWQPGDAGGRRTAGLGLGLSLVKHIVELHGGTVTVESKGEGKGARFIINLPYRAVRLPSEEDPAAPSVEQTAQPTKSAPRVPAASVLAGLTILVVDDERDARELVSTILRQYGAEVRIAASASEALRLIIEAQPLPDLLVSDVSMPEEDGYSLIRKVRTLSVEQGGGMPAVALTAYGRMEDRIRALTAGFQMHLPKPIEPTELILVAANLTGRDTGDLEV